MLYMFHLLSLCYSLIDLHKRGGVSRSARMT